MSFDDWKKHVNDPQTLTLDSLKKTRDMLMKKDNEDTKWYSVTIEGQINFKFWRFHIFEGVSMITPFYPIPFIRFNLFPEMFITELGWFRSVLVIRYRLKGEE